MPIQRITCNTEEHLHELQRLHVPVDLFRYIANYLPFYSISEDRFVDQDFLFHHTEKTKSMAQQSAEEYMKNPLKIITKRLFGKMRQSHQTTTFVFLFPFIKIDEPEMITMLDSELLMRKRFLGIYIPFVTCFDSIKRFIHLEKLVLSMGDDYTLSKDAVISTDLLQGLTRLDDLKVKFPLHWEELVLLLHSSSSLKRLSIELYSSDGKELFTQLLTQCKRVKNLSLFGLNLIPLQCEWQLLQRLQVLCLDGFDLQCSFPSTSFQNIKSLHLLRCVNVETFLPCLGGEVSMTQFSLKQMKKFQNLYVLETFLNNNNQSLRYLDLSENLNLLSPRTFSLENLTHFPHLSYLNLNHSQFVDHLNHIHPLQSIIEWLKKCPNLLVFHFESTLSLFLSKQHVLDLLHSIAKSKLEIVSLPVSVIEQFQDHIEKELVIQNRFLYSYWLQRN